MKKAIFLVTIVMAFSACKNNDNIADIETNKKIISNGSWKVSYFFDKDKDETSDFAGHTLQFMDNGVFKVSNSTATYQGTWSMQAASSDHGQKLIINITGNKYIDELADDWLVISITNSQIKLRDDNDSHIEELHLVKN
jgi:hypothetical protein